MEQIKGNLDKRICDCLDGATNTETYREFIINGYKEIGCGLTKEKIDHLDNASNDELNKIVDELDYLLEK